MEIGHAARGIVRVWPALTKGLSGQSDHFEQQAPSLILVPIDDLRSSARRRNHFRTPLLEEEIGHLESYLRDDFLGLAAGVALQKNPVVGSGHRQALTTVVVSRAQRFVSVYADAFDPIEAGEEKGQTIARTSGGAVGHRSHLDP
jgi:hypothetical protein